ncbi:MAG: 30S ribosomal protein S4 [Patescibacteria group bacterium]|nr:30S ribosomal protein S4 [Patescibacteria group bacterium]
MNNNKCKICKRLGQKLFLKGERCFSPKCPMAVQGHTVRKMGGRRRKMASEYGKELKEKQKLRNWYNLRENQFKKYVKEVLAKQKKSFVKVPLKTETKSSDSVHLENKVEKEDTSQLLLKKLESRLDNVVFRMGFSSSRRQARQIVNHKHFLVNGKAVNIPFFEAKVGDKISLSLRSKKKPIFGDLPSILEKHKPPSWIRIDVKKMEGEIIADPSFEEAVPPAEISAIFEFYSR